VDSWQSAVCGAFAGAEDYIILGRPKWGEKVKIFTLGIPHCLDEESFAGYLRKESILGGKKKTH
jgi:hypothetical protein